MNPRGNFITNKYVCCFTNSSLIKQCNYEKGYSTNTLNKLKKHAVQKTNKCVLVGVPDYFSGVRFNNYFVIWLIFFPGLRSRSKKIENSSKATRKHFFLPIFFRGRRDPRHLETENRSGKQEADRNQLIFLRLDPKVFLAPSFSFE